MLRTKSVAKLIEQKLNSIGAEKFNIINSAGSYEAGYTNGVLKQSGGTITPVQDYTTSTGSFGLEFIVSVLSGFERQDAIVEVLNKFIEDNNGKIEEVDKGKLMLLFKPLTIDDYETRGTTGQSVVIRLGIDYNYSKANGTKYELALITNTFNSSSNNTRYFETKAKQVEWFDARVEEGAEYSEVLTPNIKSLILTNQIYTNSGHKDLNDLLLKNYAIIRETSLTGQIKHYYYDIESINLNAYNLVSVDLKMDTIQTHLISGNVEIDECIVNRACLDRFVENEDGTVSFDTTPTSALFESENTETLPKRAISKHKVQFNFTGDEDVDEWLDKNVAYWVYVFVNKSPQTSYTIQNFAENTGTSTIGSVDTVVRYKMAEDKFNVAEYGVLAYPVMKTKDKNIYVEIKGEIVTKKVSLSVFGFDGFRSLNSDTSYIYNIKYSMLSPLSKNIDLEVDDDDNLKITPTSTARYIFLGQPDIGELVVYTARGDFVETNSGLLTRITQDIGAIESYAIEPTLAMPTSFTKEEIKNSKKDIKFNPKLYSQDFVELAIMSSDGETFEYDYQKIGKEKINILYTEPIQAEITKYYARLKESGLYSKTTENNYMGLVGSTDTAVSFSNTAYAQFIANNRNFWLQSNFKMTESIGRSVGSGVFAGILSRNVIGALSAVGSGVLSGYTQEKDRQYTIDNLKKSPTSLKNASGNVLFNTYVQDLGLFVEERTCLEKEKEDANDIMVMTGFSYNKLAKIKDFINIRHYFNYIQANIETISGGDIANTMREDIRQRFANGIRFWNVDNVDYSMENYEKWLEEA